MEFNRGMAGVLIVVLSLIVSVGIGVITNINEETVDKDVETYVADITGAFKSEREQSYVTFNPASNFNGYTTTVSNEFPVNFDPSSYTNNYPIKKAATFTDSYIGHVSEIASELSLTTQTAYSTISFYKQDIITSSRSYPSLDEKVGAYVTVGGLSTGTGTIPVLEMSDVITKLVADASSNPSNTLTTVKITIPITVTESVTFPLTDEESGLNALSGPWYFVDNYINIQKRGTNSQTVYTQAILESVGIGNSFSIDYTYSVASGRGVWSVNNTTIAVAEPSQFYVTGPTDVLTPHLFTNIQKNWVQISTNTNINSTSTWSYQDTPAYTDSMIVTTYYDEFTEYLDTRFGVGIPNMGTTTWSNGESNGVVDIVFSAPEEGSDYSNTAVMNIASNNVNYTDTFTISKTGGNTYIATNGGDPLNIGAWNQILLRINTIDGTLTTIPISNWSNFNTYTLSEFIISAGTLTHTGDLKSIEWTASNSFRLQVVNTQVFLNTYGVIMLDPYITVSSLWPNYSRFLIEFNKVATIGNSITIGNQTFNLDGNMIVISRGQNVEPLLLDVTSLKLYYDKITENDVTSWNVTMESNGVKYAINVPTTYISLEDKWYFNTSFYNIETKKVQQAVWNPIYQFDFQVVGLFMAGAILLIGLFAFKRGFLDGLSMIILITTEIILIFILGGS